MSIVSEKVDRSNYLDRILACGVNPNIKLVKEYNYSGGFWFSLPSLFFAHRS